jgi:UDP-N-acetylglucosamine acyltransferase
MCGVSSVVLMDIPPYVTCGGQPLAAVGINSEGLKRRGFSTEAIANVKRAYKILYRNGLSFADAKAALMNESSPEIQTLAGFLAASTRGIVR